MNSLDSNRLIVQQKIQYKSNNKHLTSWIGATILICVVVYLSHKYVSKRNKLKNNELYYY